MIDALENRLAGRFTFPIFSQLTSAWRHVHGSKWLLLKLYLAMMLCLFLLAASMAILLGYCAPLLLALKNILFQPEYLSQHSAISHALSYVMRALNHLFVRGLLTALFVGHLVFVINVISGDRPPVSSIIDPFSHFWRLFITSALSGFILLGSAFIVAILFLTLPIPLAMIIPPGPTLKLLTSLAYFLGLAIPILIAIYLIVTLHYAPMLAYHHNLHPWRAIVTSYKISCHCWFRLFITLIMGILFSLLLSVTIIGAFWAMPFISLLHGVIYNHLFGEAV